MTRSSARTTSPLRITTGLLVALLTGCPAAAPAVGSERGACYGNGTCDGALVCLSDVCVRGEVDADHADGGPTVDAAVAPPLDGGDDAGTDAGDDAPSIDASTFGMPCNPSFPDDCAASEVCRVDLSGSNVCSGPGTYFEGDPCDAEINDCQTGLICTPEGAGSAGICRWTCDSTCEGTDLCLSYVAFGALHVCYALCDPLVEWSCAGLSCIPLAEATEAPTPFLCAGTPGTGVRGAPCDDGCVDRTFCASDQGADVCAAYCRVSDGDPCPTTCTPFRTGDTVGYCRDW